MKNDMREFWNIQIKAAPTELEEQLIHIPKSAYEIDYSLYKQFLYLKLKENLQLLSNLTRGTFALFTTRPLLRSSHALLRFITNSSLLRSWKKLYFIVKSHHTLI
jgi:hypothetical protein